MSVLVKGMEMPKTCADCWALDDSGDYPYCLITQEQRGYTFRTREERMGKCPLVEIPPHGRLIDEGWVKTRLIETLEKLKKNPEMSLQEMHLIAAFHTLGVMIDEAPTIIEAEEGEG